MPKTLARIFSLLLIPCLIADPTMASTWSIPPISLKQNTRQERICFGQQALGARALQERRIISPSPISPHIPRRMGFLSRRAIPAILSLAAIAVLGVMADVRGWAQQPK